MPEITDTLLEHCMQSPLFKALVNQLAKEMHDEKKKEWLNEKEAKELLNISSHETFRKYRNTGKIEFRVLSPKNIVYRRTSLEAYIENSPKELA